MKEGYIKLYRKSLESIIFTSDKGWKVWTWCLLKANHEKNTFFLGRKEVEVGPGQFVTGRNIMASELSMSGSTAWWWLLELEKQFCVDIKKTPKYSIITVLKWKDYQVLDNKSYSKKTTDKQQKDTNKNDKNEKNTIVASPILEEEVKKPRPQNILYEQSQELMKEYQALYKKHIKETGEPYFSDKAYLKLVFPPLRKLGLERMKQLLNAYIGANDNIYKENVWSISCFLSYKTINKLNTITK